MRLFRFFSLVLIALAAVLLLPSNAAGQITSDRGTIGNGFNDTNLRDREWVSAYSYTKNYTFLGEILKETRYYDSWSGIFSFGSGIGFDPFAYYAYVEDLQSPRANDRMLGIIDTGIQGVTLNAERNFTIGKLHVSGIEKVAGRMADNSDGIATVHNKGKVNEALVDQYGIINNIGDALIKAAVVVGGELNNSGSAKITTATVSGGTLQNSGGNLEQGYTTPMIENLIILGGTVENRGGAIINEARLEGGIVNSYDNSVIEKAYVLEGATGFYGRGGTGNGNDGENGTNGTNGGGGESSGGTAGKGKPGADGKSSSETASDGGGTGTIKYATIDAGGALFNGRGGDGGNGGNGGDGGKGGNGTTNFFLAYDGAAGSNGGNGSAGSQGGNGTGYIATVDVFGTLYNGTGGEGGNGGKGGNGGNGGDANRFDNMGGFGGDGGNGGNGGNAGNGEGHAETVNVKGGTVVNGGSGSTGNSGTTGVVGERGSGNHKADPGTGGTGGSGGAAGYGIGYIDTLNLESGLVANGYGNKSEGQITTAYVDGGTFVNGYGGIGSVENLTFNGGQYIANYVGGTSSLTNLTLGTQIDAAQAAEFNKSQVQNLAFGADYGYILISGELVENTNLRTRSVSSTLAFTSDILVNAEQIDLTGTNLLVDLKSIFDSAADIGSYEFNLQSFFAGFSLWGDNAIDTLAFLFGDQSSVEVVSQGTWADDWSYLGGMIAYTASDDNGGGNTAPEPATLLIVGLGIAGLAAARRRRK